MRWAGGLFVSLCVGCAGSSSPSAGGASLSAVDVSIPAPPSGPDRTPRRRTLSHGDLSGTWRFVHGGEPWFVARIQQRGAAWTAELTFTEEISWVRFEIARIVVPPTESGRSILLVGVDGDEEQREITLRRTGSGARLEGSVEGSSYEEPFPVVATRVR